jgi:uncharacterized membrane protein
VVDRLGEGLCEIAPRHLPSGVTERGGRAVLFVPPVDYEGLLETMFDMIRQHASAEAAVIVRLFDVLTTVLCCERDPARIAALDRLAKTVLGDALRDIPAERDRNDVQARYVRLLAVRRLGARALLESNGKEEAG